MVLRQLGLLTVFSTLVGPAFLTGCAAPVQSIGVRSAFDRARPVALSFERATPEPKTAFLVPQNNLPREPSLEADRSRFQNPAEVRTVVHPSPIYQQTATDVDQERQPEIVFSQSTASSNGLVSPDPSLGSGADNASASNSKPQPSRKPGASETASQ
jgi:hypothetical protein